MRGEHPDFTDEEDKVKPLDLVIGGMWGWGLNTSRLGTEGEGCIEGCLSFVMFCFSYPLSYFLSKCAL